MCDKKSAAEQNHLQADREKWAPGARSGTDVSQCFAPCPGADEMRQTDRRNMQVILLSLLLTVTVHRHTEK